MKKLISIILTFIVCFIGMVCIGDLDKTPKWYNICTLVRILGAWLITTPAIVFWIKYFDNKLK